MWMCLHEESSFQANYYHYHRIWTMHGPAGWPGSDPGVAPQKTVFLPAACTHWVWLGLGFHHDKITTSALKLLKALHYKTEKKHKHFFWLLLKKSETYWIDLGGIKQAEQGRRPTVNLQGLLGLRPRSAVKIGKWQQMMSNVLTLECK